MSQYLGMGKISETPTHVEYPVTNTPGEPGHLIKVNKAELTADLTAGLQKIDAMQAIFKLHRMVLADPNGECPKSATYATG